MPYKDEEVRRRYHADYVRERYQTDPEYRRRHQEAARRSTARQRSESRALIAEAKSVGCTFCPEDESACLDFHHVRGEKRFAIGEAMRGGFSSKRVVEELAKCIVVCANCHRKIHAGLLVYDLTAV